MTSGASSGGGAVDVVLGEVGVVLVAAAGVVGAGGVTVGVTDGEPEAGTTTLRTDPRLPDVSRVRTTTVPFFVGSRPVTRTLVARPA